MLLRLLRLSIFLLCVVVVVVNVVVVVVVVVVVAARVVGVGVLFVCVLSRPYIKASCLYRWWTSYVDSVAVQYLGCTRMVFSISVYCCCDLYVKCLHRPK